MEQMQIYWIRKPTDTDIFTQGYVGISNNIKRRFREHEKCRGTSAVLFSAINKYSWDWLVKGVIATETSREAAMALENTFRPTENIGWNIRAGGDTSPDTMLRMQSTQTTKDRSNAGKKGWENKTEADRKAHVAALQASWTRERRSEAARVRWNNRTPEQIRAIQDKAEATRKRNRETKRKAGTRVTGGHPQAPQTP